jgi:hypothetical protein
MNTWKIFITILLLTVYSFILTAENSHIDGNEENLGTVREQKPATIYTWLIWKATVKPGEVSIFQEEFLSILNGAKDIPEGQMLTLYNEPTRTFYFFYPTTEDGKQENVFKYWHQETEKKDMKKYLDESSLFITQTMPQYSQIPSNKTLLHTVDENYMHVDIVEIHPGADRQFKDLLKELISKHKSNMSACDWLYVHQVLIGENLPRYLFFSGGCPKGRETEGLIPLVKFFENKKAFGSVIKKINSFDLRKIPKLSTLSLPVQPA